MDIHFGHYATSDGLPQKHDGEEQGFAPGSTQRLKFTQKIRPASSAANVLVVRISFVIFYPELTFSDRRNVWGAMSSSSLSNRARQHYFGREPVN
jgi:hypothetical protein